MTPQINRLNKKVLYGAILVIIIVAASAVLILTRPTSPNRIEHTYPSVSRVVNGGNDSYPGWYSFQSIFSKGDEAEITVQSSSGVDLYVLPDDALQSWAQAYYDPSISEDPGALFPWWLSIKTSSNVTLATLVFTAPNDGTYDIVALNFHPATPTVTISGKFYSTG